MFALSTVVLSVAFVATAFFMVIKLVTFIHRTRKIAKHFSTFPGRETHWLWGTLEDYPGPDEAGLAWQRQIITEFPLMGCVWLGPFTPMVMLDHPDTARKILRTSEPKAKRIYDLIRPWVGDGLLLSNGEKWNRNRRLLTPAFHFDILRPYMTINNQAADIFLDELAKPKSADGSVEVFSVVCPFTLDVVLRCAFSYETNCQTRGVGHPYVNAVLAISDLVSTRFFKPWLQSDLIYSLTSDGRKFKKHCRYVHKVSEEIIAKRKQALGIDRQRDKEGRKRCLDFLDVLLTSRDENDEGLTDMEIRDEVDTFLFEGHDTTASAISWTLFSFAENPEIQRKVQKEVDSILEGRDTDYILWEDLPKLEYLTMCLKESLRLHSPVPFISRQLTKDLKIDEFTILKGTIVGMATYNIHHNPTVWEDSLKFLPERFTPEAANGRDAYAFVPFSAGSRNCIGQNFAMHEMKVILARILRRFNLELTPNRKAEKLMSVVMRSKNGIYINAKPRW